MYVLRRDQNTLIPQYYPRDLSTNIGTLFGARFINVDASFIVAAEYSQNSQSLNLIHQTQSARGPRWRYADISFVFIGTENNNIITSDFTAAKINNNKLWIHDRTTGEIIVQNLRGIKSWTETNYIPIIPALTPTNIGLINGGPENGNLTITACEYPSTITHTPEFTVSAESYNYCNYNLTYSTSYIGPTLNVSQRIWFTRTETDLSLITNFANVNVIDDISFTTPRNLYSFVSVNNFVLDHNTLDN